MSILIRNTLLILFAAAVLLGTVAAIFAPYIYVELWPWRFSYDEVSSQPAEITKGQMFDDYFVVEKLDERTFAIGEPRYYQGNYTYLIIGEKRALMFDSGSGMRDIRPVVASLTKLPVTVLPSHLHFDHLGGVNAFDHVAMIDLPQTRNDVVDGVFKPGRYEFLGMFDGRTAPTFEVKEWISPGSTIDLGGRSLTALAVPGHTSQSVALVDVQARQLFAGDLIYPTMVYAFLPDASLSAYRETTRRLLASLPENTTIWSAHCCRSDEGKAAPWLAMGDLRDLDHALATAAAGRSGGEGFYPRSYPVNEQMVLGTSFPWNNR